MTINKTYNQASSIKPRHQDITYPYTSPLIDFEFETDEYKISWAANIDNRFQNVHSFFFRCLYTLRNTCFEEGWINLSLEETIEDLKSRNKLWHDARIAEFPTGFEETIFGRSETGFQTEKESINLKDPFNNYQLIMDANRKFNRLFTFDPEYPESTMTKLGTILSLRSAVYGNPHLENLYKPFIPEADILSCSLLAVHTTNSTCSKLVERLLRLNDSNVYNEVNEGWCFDNKNLMTLLLLPQGIIKWIIPFFMSKMRLTDLQDLLYLKKTFTNLSIIQFACFSFISSLSDDCFETILELVEQAKCTSYTEDDFRLITLAEVINQTDVNIFFEKPELLQTVRMSKMFQEVGAHVTTNFNSEVIHDPELDIRGHFANTNTNTGEAAILPLNWSESEKSKDLPHEVSPVNKIRPSPLKRRLLRFFKLERSNRKALRQIKQSLRRKSFRNPAAERLHGQFPPSAIEQKLESKFLTRRLIQSLILPFSNDLIPDDDDGYISDTTLKAKSTSSSSKNEEIDETSDENDCGGTDFTELKPVSPGSEKLISDLHTATTLDACPQVNSNDYEPNVKKHVSLPAELASLATKSNKNKNDKKLYDSDISCATVTSTSRETMNATKENFMAKTILDKCSTQQIIDFNKDCGDNELGVNDNTLISDEVSAYATSTAKKTEEKEELHNHNEISTTNVEKHKDGVANALTSSAGEEGSPAKERKSHNWFDMVRYVNGLIKS